MAALNGLEDRARFGQGSLFEPFRDSFAPGNEVDVVVSNPPQSPREMVIGSYARKLAVDGGERGDDMLKAVLREAHLWLKRDGCAYLATSSLADPGSVLREAEELFEEVRVVAEHEVPFDLWRLEKWEVLRRLEREESAEIVVKDGFPYWRVRVLRCRLPSGRG